MSRASAQSPQRVKAWPKILLSVLALAAIVIAIATVEAWSALGTTPKGARLERITSSPAYRDGRFHDSIPRVEPDVLAASLRWVKGVEQSTPSGPLPVIFPEASAFSSPPASELRITWFGHSSLLVELESFRVLIDPIWGERCSPSRFMGPRRFHPVPIALSDLPPIDAVLISHDHYDHLDYATILELEQRKVVFVVPLGVGAHLEYWGVDPERIRELDWWQETSIKGLTLVATPARHFSGRGLAKDITLWSGWALIGARRRAYYSGDTAMFDGFAEIGKRFGPFDATMIEVGAYDAMWADVHLGPEQAVDAHLALRGRVLFPVHWGSFDLALHSWVEPVERLLVAAKQKGVTVVTPKPGQSIEPVRPPTVERWWPKVPWKTAEEAPVVSSGLKRP